MKTIVEFGGNGNSETVDLIEDAIRNRAKEIIEAQYEEEVKQFLERTASLVDKDGKRKAVKNGHYKERTVLTTCGYVKVRLPRNRRQGT